MSESSDGNVLKNKVISHLNNLAYSNYLISIAFPLATLILSMLGIQYKGDNMYKSGDFLL